MTVWIDGRLVADGQASVSVFDHGLTVGDGVFETTRLEAGEPLALSRHLARMARSCVALGLAKPDDDQILAAVAEVLASAGQPAEGRLRITVTGGPSPLGSVRGDAAPTLVVALVEPSHRPATAAVVTVPWPRNDRSPLAGTKTTSYAENVVALRYALERGADEAIFADTRGRLSEGTGSNVFVVRDRRLLTPALTTGCLPGVTRGLVVEWFDAEEDHLPLSALVEADEAFLTSSTRDLMPLRSVDGHELPAAPGPVTETLMKAYAERVAKDVDP